MVLIVLGSFVLFIERFDKRYLIAKHAKIKEKIKSFVFLLIV
jgi:hypothetical protein